MSTFERAPGDRDPSGDLAEAGPFPVLDMSFDRDALIALRSAVAAHASRLGLESRRIDELVLAAHELASNAVLHGGGSGRLRLWASSDQLTCEVTDTGPGLTDAGLPRGLPPAASAGGRGLWLVRALSDAFSARSATAGTTVTISVALSR